MGRRPGEPDITWRGRDPLAHGMSLGRGPSYSTPSLPTSTSWGPTSGLAGTGRPAAAPGPTPAARPPDAALAAAAMTLIGNVGWGIVAGAAAYGVFRFLSPAPADPGSHTK
jgi:hypothetical protein